QPRRRLEGAVGRERQPVGFEIVGNSCGSRGHRNSFGPVMPALVAGIHVFLSCQRGVDGRGKPGHDVERAQEPGWSVISGFAGNDKMRGDCYQPPPTDKSMADKSDKSNKLKARLPRGLSDRGPAELAATRRMIDEIRAVYERYGFEAVETPAFEYTDALGKFLPDQDRPNEGVFSFQDDDEQGLSLRYDLTAPLARYVAENFDVLAKPYRSYRYGWVFRNEKPGPGRFRQFMQFDADTVGSASMAADAEMCMMAADTMETLGLAGKFVVRVNNRKLLDGVLESVELGGEENAGKRLIVLRAIDKLDRLVVDGVRQLVGGGRKDESGDFTRGAGLNSEQIATIEKLYGHQAERSQDFFMRRTKDDAASNDDMTLSGADGHNYVVGDPRFLETYSRLFP